MSRIIDEGDVWKLEIYPEATPAEEINEISTKGYRALLGYESVSERHVIMCVWYNKDQYPIGEVLNKINDMRECPVCDSLDRDRLKDISIESPDVGRGYGPLVGRGLGPGRGYREPYPQTVPQTSPAPPTPDASKNAKDMFSSAIFDAYLTPAGKLLMGNVFGDETLTEEAFPKTPDEMARLWEDTTAGRFLRSPDEAKEFISVIKDNEDEPGTPGTTRKKSTKNVTRGIVIY